MKYLSALTHSIFTHLKGFRMEKNNSAAKVTYHPDDANNANCINAPKTLQPVSSSRAECVMCDNICATAMPRSRRVLRQYDNIKHVN